MNLDVTWTGWDQDAPDFVKSAGETPDPNSSRDNGDLILGYLGTPKDNRSAPMAGRLDTTTARSTKRKISQVEMSRRYRKSQATWNKGGK